MTYNTNVPNTNQSPGRLPAQAAVNWTRLKEIIEANHLFTDTASTTQGFHQIVDWVKQTSAPSASANGAQTYVQDATYTRSTTSVTAPHLFHLPTTPEDTNTFPISVLPVRAAVNFKGTIAGNNAVQTIRSSYNIVDVKRTGTGTGQYTITITSGAVPSGDYFPLMVGMGTTNVEVIPYIAGATSVTSSMTATTLKIQFKNNGSAGGFEDVEMGSVVIIGG